MNSEVRGHDLSLLVAELGSYEPDVKALSDAAKKLDQYYIPTRYANAFHSG